MSEITDVVQISQEAIDIADKVRSLRTSIMAHSIELGNLLSVVQEQKYFRQYGYTNFGDWVEQGSGLDMSARQASYLIRIVRRAAQLGIEESLLSNVRLSSAKEILSLPESIPGEVVKGLLEEAQTSPLSEVRARANALRESSRSHVTLSFDTEAMLQVWTPAIERIRMMHGGFKVDGQGVDLSDSQAALLMAGEILALPLPVEETVVEAEFEDVVEQ